MNRLSLIIIALVVFVTVDLNSQTYNWQNYTNKNKITSLEFYGGYLWATSNGGVVRYDLSSGESKSYINSDGLGSINLSFSTFAGNDTTYFGSLDGTLTRMMINSDDFFVSILETRDGEPLPLYDADTSEGYLWIASELGVIKFDRFRHDGEVKEIYRTLGNFTPEMPINDVLIYDGKIYAAGIDGIAYADYNDHFLLDPTHWHNIPIEAGNEVLSLAALDGEVLEDFEKRVYVGLQDGFRWIDDDSLMYTDFFSNRSIISLRPKDNGVFVVADSAGKSFLYQHFTNNSFMEFTIDEIPDGELNNVLFTDKLILGTSNSGLFLNSDGNFEQLALPGPGNNDIVGGGFDNKTLYTINVTGSVSRLQDNIWETFDVSTRELFHGLVDNKGDVWIGSFGDGVVRFQSDESIQTYGSANSPLHGVAGASEFVVVTDLYEDNQGRIWVSCSDSDPRRPLLVFDPQDSLWASWEDNSTLFEIKSRAVAAGDGFAAIGFEFNGVAVLNYGASPFDDSGDELQLYGRSRGLPSETINALAVDRDNRLWVGTNLGLAYFDDDIKFFFPVSLPDDIGTDVRTITFDSRNNLWVGTTTGLALLTDKQKISHSFTTENSDLIFSEIKSLAFDSESGLLVISTPGGLSILDYNLPTSSDDNVVYPYPNPFILSSVLEQPLQFNIDQRAEVRIYTVSGELVRLTNVNLGWDGRNDAGDLVASGIYLYELIADDLSRHRGKILVVRK